MTKSEAAKICQSIKFMMDIEDYSEAVEEALNMAIETLEHEPTAEYSSDVISRQAAIDALYDKGLSMTAWGELLAMKWSDIQTCIELLPSAQPFTAEQIQIMQELESAQVEKAYELGKADRPTGHWIENDNGTFSCSNCQSWIPKEQHHYARHCLYCGARMESEE